MGNRMTKPSPEPQDRGTKSQSTKEPKKSAFQKFLARFQLHPNKHENGSKQLTAPEAKVPSPPPKPPLRNQAERLQSKSIDEIDQASKSSEWTEVSLQCSDSPPKHKSETLIKTIPVPPPRKHKAKLQEILEAPKKKINFETKAEQVQEQRVPVEEPIIVPKKVHEHICDGTHRHVRNIVNGIVVDQIVQITNKDLKQNKSAKTSSTLSLPSYVDLKKKDEKRAISPTKSSKKKSSASSLPTDKKPKSLHTTAEKIESYMIRCKSFGSIIPHGKSEKLKPVEHASDKESIDSWSGLEDWDLGIIEHDVSTELPQVPIKKKTNNKTNESLKLDTKKHNDISNINSIKPDTTEFEELLSAMDKSLSKTEACPIAAPSCEVKSNMPSPTTPIKVSETTYPFKQSPAKNIFDNDAFFTSQFINYERSASINSAQLPLPTKLAPLAAFDSDKDSEKEACIDYNNTGDMDKNVDAKSMKNNEQNIEIIKENMSSSELKTKPKLIPRRKSSSGHSKLLKYIKNENKEPKKSAKTDSLIEEPKNEKLVCIKTKDVSEHIKEPEIVPTIKNIQGPWNDLMKREDMNNVPLIEQESSISDLIETSSDDTRSTTIDTSYK